MTASAVADTYTVELPDDPVPAGRSRSGRLVLFFTTPGLPGWQRRRPIDGPFFEAPQPIASVPVPDASVGRSITIDGAADAFPGPLNELEGPVRVQAILDLDRTERSHTDGPGNLFSDPVDLVLSAADEEQVRLTLAHRVPEPSPPQERPNLKWVRLHSPLLSAFYGRDVHHHAGVALPKGYLDPDAAERRWPAIYVIPGFGGRHDVAGGLATMLRWPGTDEIAPQAVYIVPDPESPLGHHGFVDSPNHGPRGTALVEELIPHLERTFRLDARREARIVTGHSSGGWSSLWLQLRWPGVFGACWSSAPDPIDFSAFQMSDLYRDASVFEDGHGDPAPSYRRQVGLDRTAVRMTVRQEAGMEHAIDPQGGSGQQWDAWEAMFSPRDPATGLPRPLFDARIGAIDREVVGHWSRFDVTRLVRADWERLGPVVTGRVRLACGTLDSFYLNRAVERFKQMVDERAGQHDGPGYVLLVDGATHGNLQDHTIDRWNEEMRAYLREVRGSD